MALWLPSGISRKTRPPTTLTSGHWRPSPSPNHSTAVRFLGSCVRRFSGQIPCLKGRNQCVIKLSIWRLRRHSSGCRGGSMPAASSSLRHAGHHVLLDELLDGSRAGGSSGATSASVGHELCADSANRRPDSMVGGICFRPKLYGVGMQRMPNITEELLRQLFADELCVLC